jgi:hypothetical protein
MHAIDKKVVGVFQCVFVPSAYEFLSSVGTERKFVHRETFEVDDSV